MSQQQPSSRIYEEMSLPTILSPESVRRSSLKWILHYTRLSLLFFFPSFIRNTVAGPASDGGPSIAQRDGEASTEKDQTRRHAHLDGLRGLAALSVFVLHLFSPFDITLGSGYGPEPSTRTIFNLPLIRVIHAGQAMVKVFFVISGFALTIKPAEHMISSPHDISTCTKLHQRLGISILKRGIRLFLPPVVTTFCAMCLARAGALMAREQIIGLPAGLVYFGILRRQTFGLQLLDWAKFVACKLTNPWVWLDGGWHLGHAESTNEFSIYGPHLWTIQTEFKCSMVLFIVHAAVLRIPQRRLQELSSLSIIIYCAAWGRWDVALFISGMLCCLFSLRKHDRSRGQMAHPSNHTTTNMEASQVSGAHTITATVCLFEASDIEASGGICHGRAATSRHLLNSSWWRRRKISLRTRRSPEQRWFDHLTSVILAALDGRILASIFRNLLLWIALVSSLWLLSYPERIRPGALGFEVLRSMRADHDFWQSAGAVLLVFVIDRTSCIRYFLMSSIVQYLGKISFAFYLVHVPVLESIGWRVAIAWRLAAEGLEGGNETGKTTVMLGSSTLAVAAHGFTLIYVLLIVIYFADLVWMYVDRPTMVLLRMLQSTLTIYLA